MNTILTKRLASGAPLSIRLTTKGTRMNTKNIEAEIIAKGLTAARVTPADIEANIASEHYFTAADGIAGEAHRRHLAGDTSPTGWYAPPVTELLTICVLVLRNGFTVTGESACASPENFNAEIGRRIARENAVAKVLPLMDYELRTHLHAQSLMGQQRIEG